VLNSLSKKRGTTGHIPPIVTPIAHAREKEGERGKKEKKDKGYEQMCPEGVKMTAFRRNSM
jgi:hypothetical protein